MEPTLSAGDTVLVNRLAYLLRNPQKGDIIAFYYPRGEKVLIKRIIKIEDKGYFIQGDNQNASIDSRHFGMIGRSNILGKVWLSVF